MSLEQRLASFRGFLLEIPRPSIPGTVQVNLPAIVAGDTTIRAISLTAKPAEGGWEIGSVAATLPGLRVARVASMMDSASAPGM